MSEDMMDEDTKRRLTSMRFFPTAQNGEKVPEWMTFIAKVNEIRPGTFGDPVIEAWWTKVHMAERYPGVDVIFSNSHDQQVVENEGVRIVLRDPDLLPVFEEAAIAIGYITGPTMAQAATPDAGGPEI